MQVRDRATVAKEQEVGNDSRHNSDTYKYGNASADGFHRYHKVPLKGTRAGVWIPGTCFRYGRCRFFVRGRVRYGVPTFAHEGG